LASGRLPSVLALEIRLSWRPAEDRRGSARVDPADECGKSVVGNAAHGVEVEVTAGPTPKWIDSAKQNADLISQ
jgi:hypothetical protein